MRNVVLAVALVGSLCDGSAQAATLYSGIAIFGDSLSDDGNYFALTKKTMPPPPYADGRFSNGPVWSDAIAADFAKKGLHAENYAYGYAHAVTYVDAGPVPPVQAPDLPAQIDEFKASGTASLLGEDGVATIWIGNNDVVTAMADAPVTVPDVAAKAAHAVMGGIESLGEAGINNFLLFNMVPLDKSPRLAGNPAAAELAKIGVGVFNTTLDDLIADYGGSAKITKLNIHEAMSKLIANPEAYGISDVTHACFIPTSGQPPCSAEQADQMLFWDDLHPTTKIHGEVADLVREKVAPVPLPAPMLLLLAGMAGLAAVGRRRT